MGTMLYGKGVFINRCFESLNQTQPDLVAEVHGHYLKAGADVIETNTFGANRMKLRGFGLGDQVREINLAGAAAARRAIEKSGCEAGSPKRSVHLGTCRAMGQDRCRRGGGDVPRTGAGPARR